MENVLTPAQELDLRATLINRGRVLVNAYRDMTGNLWAVSRPTGARNPRNDLRHELLVSGDSVLIRITHYPGGVLGD